MADSGRHLALIIPGLCGPDSDPPVSDYLQTRPVALDRLLSRSRMQSFPGTDLDMTLCHCFGLDAAQQALPVAPLTWLSDTGQAGPGYRLRADPVHLRADQSCLHLFDSHTFPVTQEEADALAAAVTKFYAHLGWQLQAVCPQRWYLSLPTAPAITTRPVMQVAGQDIDPCLPQGRDAADWHAILNEVQMLLHNHPVNVAREQRGEPAINSLWFWGGGFTPDKVQARVLQIATDHPLGLGLAARTGIKRSDVPVDGEELLSLVSEGVTLVVNDSLASATQYGDIESWLEGVRNLEQHWFMPLLELLRQGSLTSLEIDPCRGAGFLSNQRQQRLFWKRDKPFEAVCE